jgi:hypothetical protein
MLTVGGDNRKLYYRDGFFTYEIDNYLYEGYTLEYVIDVLDERNRVPSFDIDPMGSQILVVNDNIGRYLLIQENSSGRYVLLSGPPNIHFVNINVRVLKIPQPNGRQTLERFQELRLRPLDQNRIGNLSNNITSQRILDILNTPTFESPRNDVLPTPSLADYSQATLQYLERISLTRPLTGPESNILGFLQRRNLENSPLQSPRLRVIDRGFNSPDISPSPPTTNIGSLHQPNFRNLSPQRSSLPTTPNEPDLNQMSYETLLKQLYGLPVQLPEFLIQNGLRITFIPFEQIPTIQIERYIFDAILQPWAGPPGTQNKIMTIFSKNGITYFAKVRYDQVLNQIFPPV